MQGHDVLPEVQRAVSVGVEGAEHMLSITLSIALGEESSVDGLELGRRDASVRTLLLEVLVPLGDLGLTELGAELQVLQKLL